MTKKLLAIAAMSACLACAQGIKLKTPPVIAPVQILKQEIEVLQVTAFTQPNTPLVLKHQPAIGTIVVVSLIGTTMLDQRAVMIDGTPLTLTLDADAQAQAMTVEVRYHYAPTQQ